MQNIIIATDSSSDISKSEAEKYHIELINMNITSENQDISDCSKEEIYERLIAGEVIKTSQPSIGKYFDLFEKAKRENKELIYICLSSKLSGTYETVLGIKRMADYEKIYIFDSLNATASEKLLVLEAVKLRDEGLNALEIIEKLEDLQKRIRLYACIDSLEYLIRGGRLSKSAGAVGGALHLKPYFTLREGSVHVIKKPRGLKHAMSDMALEVERHPIDEDYPVIGLYAYNENNLKNFLNEIKDENISKVELNEIGPLIASFVGPGGFGIVYVEKKH